MLKDLSVSKRNHKNSTHENFNANIFAIRKRVPVFLLHSTTTYQTLYLYSRDNHSRVSGAIRAWSVEREQRVARGRTSALGRGRALAVRPVQPHLSYQHLENAPACTGTNRTSHRPHHRHPRSILVAFLVCVLTFATQKRIKLSINQ